MWLSKYVEKCFILIFGRDFIIEIFYLYKILHSVCVEIYALTILQEILV